MKKLLLFLCVIPTLLKAQPVKVSNVVQGIPTVPTLAVSITAFSNPFITPAGTASGEQTFTISTFNVGTTTVTFNVIANTVFEASKDGITWIPILNYAPSGGTIAGQPVVVHVRVKSSAPSGSYSGQMTVVCGSLSKTIDYSATVNSVTASITLTGTFSTFTTSPGVASSSQSFTVSGTTLGGDISLASPNGFELSADNVNFQSTPFVLTQSGGVIPGQPKTMYVRVKASATAGTYNDYIIATSPGASNQQLNVQATVASGTTKAQFNFSNTSQPVTGWTNVYGMNNVTDAHVTDAGTGIRFNTDHTKMIGVAGSVFASNADGYTAGASYPSEFPSAVSAGMMYVAGAQNATFANMGYNCSLDNLTAGNYTIKIWISIKSTVNSGINYPEFNFQFGTGARQIYNSAAVGAITGRTVNAQNNSTLIITVTGTIAAGETIKMGVNVPDGLDPGIVILNAMTVAVTP